MNLFLTYLSFALCTVKSQKNAPDSIYNLTTFARIIKDEKNCYTILRKINDIAEIKQAFKDIDETTDKNNPSVIIKIPNDLNSKENIELKKKIFSFLNNLEDDKFIEVDKFRNNNELYQFYKKQIISLNNKIKEIHNKIKKSRN